MRRTGSLNSITDVPGIIVGCHTDLELLSGVTVVMASPGAVGPVDVRGGAPGTRETDLLDPVNLIERVDVARAGLSLNWCKMVLYPHPRFQSIIELFDEKDHELTERPTETQIQKNSLTMND